MTKRNWRVWLAGVLGCMLGVQVSVGDNAARERRQEGQRERERPVAGEDMQARRRAQDDAGERRREGQRERERERPAVREDMQARRQANLEFWQSLEGRDPAAAIPKVKAHLEAQHAAQRANMDAHYARIKERFEAGQGEPQDADAQRAETLERLEERFTARKTALETQFAATIAALDALAEKEDVTWAQVRAAAQPRRERRERPEGRERTEDRDRQEGRERQRRDPRAED